MSQKYLYIYTIGCQMNVYESEKYARVLEPLGFTQTDNLDIADLVICNTCSVREKAQEKAFSFLGSINERKKTKPEIVLVMAGCVAQQEGDKVFQRAPYVDIVLGTNAVTRFPGIVEQFLEDRMRVADTQMDHVFYELDEYQEQKKNTGISKFITIMQGCDNYCTYCIVPHVRGRENSRHPDKIISEIKSLVASGVKEITLLGQNVNSYGIKEGLCSFPELLSKINDIEGLERIRFATSHPKDLSDELIYAFRDLGKLCLHLHLPVQCGSDRILKKMNRKYTRSQYLDRIEKLRSHCPDISLSSDMIVGFPGETEEDFQETLSLMRLVQFDSLFAFIYSDRPGVPACSFKDKLTEPVKKRRLHELLELQEEHTTLKNQKLVGKTLEILIEGKSRKNKKTAEKDPEAPLQWSGRTSCNKIVNFNVKSSDKENDLTGEILDIKIEKALSHSLWGELTPGGVNRD